MRYFTSATRGISVPIPRLAGLCTINRRSSLSHSNVITPLQYSRAIGAIGAVEVTYPDQSMPPDDMETSRINDDAGAENIPGNV